MSKMPRRHESQMHISECIPVSSQSLINEVNVLPSTPISEMQMIVTSSTEILSSLIYKAFRGKS